MGILVSEFPRGRVTDRKFGFERALGWFQWSHTLKRIFKFDMSLLKSHRANKGTGVNNVSSMLLQDIQPMENAAVDLVEGGLVREQMESPKVAQ